MSTSNPVPSEHAVEIPALWIRVEQSPADRAEALTLLQSLIRPLEALVTPWYLWNPRLGARVRVTAERFEGSLPACVIASSSGAETLSFGLRATPDAGPDDVSMLVHVGLASWSSPQRDGATGVSAWIDLDPVFAPDDLAGWVEQWAAIAPISAIDLGPRRFIERERFGCLAFRSEPPASTLPGGATVRAVERGLLISAHALGGADGSDAAGEAIARVAAAYAGRSLELEGTLVMQQRPIEVPTYLRDDETTQDGDSTAMVPLAFVPGAALPFTAGAASQWRSAKEDAVAPTTERMKPEGGDADETVMLPSPFKKQ